MSQLPEKVACLGDPVSRRGAIPGGEDFLYGGKAGWRGNPSPRRVVLATGRLGRGELPGWMLLSPSQGSAV